MISKLATKQHAEFELHEIVVLCEAANRKSRRFLTPKKFMTQNGNREQTHISAVKTTAIL